MKRCFSVGQRSQTQALGLLMKLAHIYVCTVDMTCGDVFVDSYGSPKKRLPRFGSDEARGGLSDFSGNLHLDIDLFESYRVLK